MILCYILLVTSQSRWSKVQQYVNSKRKIGLAKLRDTNSLLTQILANSTIYIVVATTYRDHENHGKVQKYQKLNKTVRQYLPSGHMQMFLGRPSWGSALYRCQWQIPYTPSRQDSRVVTVVFLRSCYNSGNEEEDGQVQGKTHCGRVDTYFRWLKKGSKGFLQ